MTNTKDKSESNYQALLKELQASKDHFQYIRKKDGKALDDALAQVAALQDEIAARDFALEIAAYKIDKLAQRLAEVEGLIKSAYMEGFSDGHSEGLTEGHPLGTNGRGSDANWGDSDIKQALSNSEGKPKCPKHETGGGPCYCDKQGGSDDHK